MEPWCPGGRREIGLPSGPARRARKPTWTSGMCTIVGSCVFSSCSESHFFTRLPSLSFPSLSIPSPISFFPLLLCPPSLLSLPPSFLSLLPSLHSPLSSSSLPSTSHSKGFIKVLSLACQVEVTELPAFIQQLAENQNGLSLVYMHHTDSLRSGTSYQNDARISLREHVDVSQ